MFLRRFATRLGLLAVLCLTTSLLFAQNTQTVNSGFTIVTFSNELLTELNSLGVTPGAVATTPIKAGAAGFPVIGGAIDLDTGSGNVVHSGGLTLTGGSTVVTLQSFIIDTTNSSAPVLTGLLSLNGAMVGRVALFNLTQPSSYSLPLMPNAQGQVRVNGVGLTLTDTAAAAINQAFSVSAFTAGQNIGKAAVTVVFPVAK